MCVGRTRKLRGSRTAGQQASRGSRLQRDRVDKESVARFLVGRVAGGLAPTSRYSPVQLQLQCKSQPAVLFRVRDLLEGGRQSLSMRQAESHGGRDFRGLLATGPDCRRRETKRAVGEGRRRESLVALLCSSQNRVKSRAVPDLRVNPSWRAGVSSWGSANNRINPSPDTSDSDFPPTVQSQGVSSSRRARPLFWLCQSPPLAVTTSSGQCVPFCAIHCRGSDLVFSLPVQQPVPPLDSSNTT